MIRFALTTLLTIFAGLLLLPSSLLAQEVKDEKKPASATKPEDKKPDAPAPDAKKPEKPEEPKKPEDPKKTDPKKPDPAKKPDEPKKEEPRKLDPKFVKHAVLTGKLVSIDSNTQALSVEVAVAVPNPGAVAGLQQAQRDLALARDPQSRINALNAIRQHQANLTTTRNETVRVEPAENMEVRLAQPKPAFDEMGNVKKLTMREIAAMRGKDKLFDAEFADLSTGQIVEITLIRPKGTPPKPKPKEEVNLDEWKPKAWRVVVLIQPPPGAP